MNVTAMAPGHHEREARIPDAEQIEEVLHLGRIRHARDDEPQSEFRPAMALIAVRMPGAPSAGGGR